MSFLFTVISSETWGAHCWAYDPFHATIYESGGHSGGGAFIAAAMGDYLISFRGGSMGPMVVTLTWTYYPHL